MEEPWKQPPDLAATEFSVRFVKATLIRGNIFGKNYKLLYTQILYKL